jgi:cytochrome c-type biogenesis protein CcmH
MSFLPPWLGLLLALLAWALAAWVLQRGMKKQAHAMGPELQSKINRRIQQEHLADLDRALAEGRLTALQHQLARDELLRHLLDDAAQADEHPTIVVPARWLGMVVALGVAQWLELCAIGCAPDLVARALEPAGQDQRHHARAIGRANPRVARSHAKTPEDAQAWLTLARLHAAQNAHAPAEQALARALALSPEPDLWIERAQMKALSAGGVYAGEPWQWIQDVLREQPQHLNALVLAGSAALSEKRHAAAQDYWQRALALVPADSEAGQGLQQALAQAAEMASAQGALVAGALSAATPAGDARPLIQGEVRVSPQVQSQIGCRARPCSFTPWPKRARVALWPSGAARPHHGQCALP